MAVDATYPLLDPPGAPDPEAVWVSYPVLGPLRPSRLARVILWDLTIAVCLLHGWGIWIGMGGREGLDNGWPLWRDDHPLYYHSALVTRDFLARTGTTAGYDPAFMSGYAKSVIFPASSTLPELVVALFGRDRPELVYKFYVLISAAMIPWVVLLAARWFGAGLWGALVAIVLYLAYIWTDFPINYAAFGMLPYLLGIPLGLVATASLAGYVERGGFLRWLVAGLASSLCVLVHVTTAMVVVPAAIAVYGAGVIRGWRSGKGFSITRHLGVWLIPMVVLGINAFWWLPGVFLAETRGSSGFVFAHSDESLPGRLAKIFTDEPLMQGVLLGLGLMGLAASARRTPIRGVALVGFAVAGGFWGYIAAIFPGLDFLQPGRHTYALYTALAVAAGIGWADVCRRLATTRGGRAEIWLSLALILVGLRVIGPSLDLSVAAHLGRTPLVHRALPARREPFLSSRPSARLLWVIDRVKQHVKPGERLLYEEGGFAVPGDPEPFEGGRFSGLLPSRCGVEVIGGPYLHASLKTNFTQFGEGKLFEKPQWDREHFVSDATLYRPAAIICWSAWARSFCKANPDLIEIKDDDGRLLIGRVKGFEGMTIRGEAQVEVSSDRIVVRDVKPGVDGLAVLRRRFSTQRSSRLS